MSVLARYGLNKRDWFYYGQWEQPPFSNFFWVHWYDDKLSRQLGVGKLAGGFTTANGYCIVRQSDLKQLKSIITTAVEQNDWRFLYKFEKYSLQILNQVLKLAQTIGKRRGSTAFNKFIATSKRAMVPWYTAVVLSDYIGDELLARKSKELNISLETLLKSIRTRETIMLKQNREAVELKNELRRLNLLGKTATEVSKINPLLWNKIKKHVELYEWVGTHHFWGEPFTIQRFFLELNSLTEPDVKKPTQPIPELNFILEAASFTQFLRQYSAEVFTMTAFAARPMLSDIAARLGITYEELLLLTPTEVNTLLQNNQKPDKIKLEKRKQYYCLLISRKKEMVIDKEKDVRAVISAFAKAEQMEGNELKGMTASAGKASGRVKIFLVPENLSKMQDGDILVTPMTTPDFIPLMKKASAIITDIGGLLSHAGIVSRELGKPCIVGTKIATKVLKDGDRVEVDAEKGIVKKL